MYNPLCLNLGNILKVIAKKKTKYVVQIYQLLQAKILG